MKYSFHIDPNDEIPGWRYMTLRELFQAIYERDNK